MGTWTLFHNAYSLKSLMRLAAQIEMIYIKQL